MSDLSGNDCSWTDDLTPAIAFMCCLMMAYSVLSLHSYTVGETTTMACPVTLQPLGVYFLLENSICSSAKCKGM